MDHRVKPGGDESRCHAEMNRHCEEHSDEAIQSGLH
jgi:hypothetical protein